MVISDGNCLLGLVCGKLLFGVLLTALDLCVGGLCGA